MSAATTAATPPAGSGAHPGADVIPLAAHRARRRVASRPRTPKTVIVRAAIVGADPPVVRHIGINDALPVAELLRTLGVAFGSRVDAPWLAEPTVGPSDCIHHVLAGGGDHLDCHWGLWAVSVDALDTYPRDAGTPQALCIGGSGDFFGVSFDTARINRELTGDDVTRSVLSAAHPAVGDVVNRSGIFDFVSLVQALGVEGAHGEPSPMAVSLAAAIPTGGVGSDAAWSLILANACMGDEDTTADIVSSTLAELGHPGFSVGDARRAAPEVARLLTLVNGWAPVDRVEVFRDVIRRGTTEVGPGLHIPAP